MIALIATGLTIENYTAYVFSVFYLSDISQLLNWMFFACSFVTAIYFIAALVYPRLYVFCPAVDVVPIYKNDICSSCGSGHVSLIKLKHKYACAECKKLSLQELKEGLR